jgi:hypothetical protein
MKVITSLEVKAEMLNRRKLQLSHFKLKEINSVG